MRQKRNRKAEEAFLERRRQARYLLFHVGGGKAKNLPMKQQLFIRSVAKECYQAYLLERMSGIPRYPSSPLARTDIPPLSFIQYRRRWYGGSKSVFRRLDVPRMMKEKLKEIDRGDGSSPLPQLHRETRMRPFGHAPKS